MEIKPCIKCGRTDRHKPEGVRVLGACKACKRNGREKHYQLNIKAFSQYNKEYARLNRDKIAQYRKEWLILNNQSDIQKERRKANPEKYRQYSLRSRAKSYINLTNSFVRTQLGLTKDMCPQGLIELKRVQLQITRKIKESRSA